MARWGKCDFKQLKNLQKKLEKLEQADLDKFNEQLVKNLAARMLAKVIKRTPVGKKPKFEGPKTVKVTGAGGKRRVFLTQRGAMYEKYWAGYVGGTLRRGWTVGAVIRKGDIYEIEVINTVKYASYVEFGHRQTPGRFVPALGKQLKQGWVKGRFIMTVSEQELQREGPKIVEKALTKYLAEVFNGK